MYITAVLE